MVTVLFVERNRAAAKPVVLDAGSFFLPAPPSSGPASWRGLKITGAGPSSPIACRH